MTFGSQRMRDYLNSYSLLAKHSVRTLLKRILHSIFF